MKKILITLIALVALSCGCVPTADQIQTVGDDVSKLSVLVDDMQEAVTKSQLVDEQKMVEFNEKIDEIQPVMVDAAEALKNAPYTEDDWENLIIGAQEAVKAGKDYIPYSEPILGILALLSGGYGLLKKKENETNAAKYQAHKQGTEAYKTTADPAAAAALYKAIGEARVRKGVG